MNAVKAITVTTLAAGMIALLAAQQALGRDRDRDWDRPTARSLHEVQSISVEGNLCPLRVSSVLNEHGISAVPGGSADAVLLLDVATSGSLWDQDSMEEGRYTATLVGRNGRTLFTTGGYEDSINLGMLCEEIGEEIADDLESSMG
jgi:hypothetical protein